MIPTGTIVRTILAYLPTRSRWGVSRRLIARANAERDARRYQAASILYEEALKLMPAAPRFHVQCGHMHKEAGDLAGAETHYLAALALMPDDPDLAIQLGHFYKVSGRTGEAETAYARALSLRPGWPEAALELSRVAAIPADDEADFATDQLAGELLPSPARPQDPQLREGFSVTRLGAGRTRVRGAYRRVLRGVEAIRGYVVSSSSRLAELSVTLDGEVIARVALTPFALPGGQTKYVFNLWHDFSDTAPGSYQVELRAADPLGAGARAHRTFIDVIPPLTEADAPDSDTIVDPPTPDGDLDAAINARPSMIRPAHRSLMAKPRAILVQRADQLGDLVCSVPAILRLKALFPEARIVGLVTAANVDLARTLGLFDDVVVADFREEVADGRKVMPLPVQERLRADLSAYAFDIAIDLGETSGSRPLLLLSGAKLLFGFKAREFPWLTAGLELYSHDPGNGNEMVAHGRRLLALVDALGAAALPDATPPLRRPDLDRGLLARFGMAAGEPYIVLHAGARLAYSRWPGFASLAGLLLEHTDLRVVIMGDEPLIGLPTSDRLTIVEGRLAFDEFDALLSFAALFVGNDSGPKHLAALRGVPVVSLHMARLNWNEWGQIFTGAIVSRRVPCAGCGIGAQPEECGKGYACLTHIRPEEVLAAALAELAVAPGQ